MKVFIQKAAQYGAKVFSSKGKHLKFRDALGHQISSPKTTSDFRAIRNFESELKRRGFVRQETTKKVKDALVKNTKETVLPASNTTSASARKTANQQTTFKDFTQKFQPNVQGPKRSELQVQGDHIIRTIRAKRVNEGAAMALRAVRSNLLPKIMTGVGAVGTVLQASKADKERRRQLARDNNLDITNPKDRAKLGRLLKKDTEAKKRAEKGDTRTEKEYRKDKADNNRLIDTTRQQLGQSKAKPGTEKRAEIDKKLKDFRDELRKPETEPVPTRAKVRVKVGQEVPKPDTTQPPRTGASPQRVRDRRSYEAQQRRNRKMNEGMLPVPSMARRLMNNPPIPQQQDKEDKFKKQYDKKFKGYDKKIRDLRKELKASNKHRDEKLNYQYKDVTNPKRPSDPVKDLKKKGTA